MIFDVPPELAAIFAEEAAELLDRLDLSSVGLGSEEGSERAERVAGMRRDLHTLKGSAGMVGLEGAVELCHGLEEVVMDFADGRRAADAELNSLAQTLSELRQECLLGGRRDVEPAAAVGEASPEPTPVEGPETVRVAVGKVDVLHSSLGELVVSRLQAADLGRDAGTLRRELSALQASWRSLSASLRGLRSHLPDAAARDLEQQTSGFASELRQVAGRGAALERRAVSQSGRLGSVTDALEGAIKEVRMLPLGPFFKSFVVPVAEAARGRGVRAELVWDERGIEVDRAVVEGLRTPLLHLLRNAVAHGIEAPALRERQGKPATGRIELSAQLDGDHFLLSVQDDGRGIDRGRVARRAAEMGVAGGDLGEDRALLRALCTAGLSTRSEVDDVAGRGIGMDAVADAVHALRGELSLTTAEGGGTTFRLRMPTSVTTARGLVVSVGPYRFGIPLSAVRRVLRTERSMYGTLEDSSVLEVDGQPVTVTSLADLVDALEDAPADDGLARPTLVLEVAGARLAVVLDDVPGELPMVVRPLGPQFASIDWLAGAALEADGSVLPVLDPRGLVERARRRRRTTRRDPAPAPAAARPTASSTRRILIVDDSVTMRTLQRSILESAGFDVIVACDGIEARDCLRTEVGVDLLITDITMPRMDGVALCRWVRSGLYADLPVIVMTSRDSEEERLMGLEAGADAWLVKGRFEQDHYLAAVRRLAG